MSTLRQAAPRGHIGLQHAVSVEEVYPADPATAPQARHLVTSALRDWGLPALRPDAALVVTELIANAVAQGESALPAEVLVRVSWTERYVVIQVGDHNPAGPPRPPRKVSETAEHGRGLMISRLPVGSPGVVLPGRLEGRVGGAPHAPGPGRRGRPRPVLEGRMITMVRRTVQARPVDENGTLARGGYMELCYDPGCPL